MAFGGQSTVRDVTSWASKVTQWAEKLGLLNKGSARQPAAPSNVSDVQPISTNTLNVTRVGGLTSLIAAAGGAALLLFNVNKTKDPAPIVVAAYASTGVVVAAALLTAAIIITADIRARAAIAVTPSPRIGPRQADISHVEAVAAQGPGGAPLDFIATLERAYEYVLINAQAANVILTLPSTSTFPWQRMVLVREDNSGHRVTIRPQGEQALLGAPEYVLPAQNSVRIYSDGQAWRPIAV
jgi:hypothetical protein